MSAAASVVSQALGDLLQHVRQYTSRGEPIGRYDQATDTIMTVTESIFSSMGDAGESKRHEKLAQKKGIARICASTSRLLGTFLIWHARKHR